MPVDAPESRSPLGGWAALLAYFGPDPANPDGRLYSWDHWKLAAVTAALVAALLAHGEDIVQAKPLLDELVYIRAFDAARAGMPLAEVEGWYYPDLLARLAVASGDITLFLQGMRALDLLGCALAIGVSMAMISRRAGVPLAVLATWLLAPATITVHVGNVSGLLVGLMVLAAGLPQTWSRNLVLLPGFLFKPYAVGVLVTRPWREALLPSIVALLAVLNTSGKTNLVNLEALSNAALARPLAELGLPVPWWMLTFTFLLFGGLALRNQWSRGFCLAWAALPIAWDHTALLLVLPWALAWRRAWHNKSPSRFLRCLVLVAVGLVINQTRFFGLVDGPRWASGLLGLVPFVAVVILAALTGDRMEDGPGSAAPPPSGRYEGALASGAPHAPTIR